MALIGARSQLSRIAGSVRTKSRAGATTPASARTSEGPRPPSVKAVGPGDHSDAATIALRNLRVLICVNRRGCTVISASTRLPAVAPRRSVRASRRPFRLMASMRQLATCRKRDDRPRCSLASPFLFIDAAPPDSSSRNLRAVLVPHRPLARSLAPHSSSLVRGFSSAPASHCGFAPSPSYGRKAEVPSALFTAATRRYGHPHSGREAMACSDGCAGDKRRHGALPRRLTATWQIGRLERTPV